MSNQYETYLGMQASALAHLRREMQQRGLDPNSSHLVADLVYDIRQQVKREEQLHLQERVNYELAKLGYGGK